MSHIHTCNISFNEATYLDNVTEITFYPPTEKDVGQALKHHFSHDQFCQIIMIWTWYGSDLVKLLAHLSGDSSRSNPQK